MLLSNLLDLCEIRAIWYNISNFDTGILMAKQEKTSYQQSVINQYYENIDTIMLTKLGELVTDLYLAETKAKRDKLWERAHKAMVKLKIKPGIISNIMKKRSVEILAKNLSDWLGKS